MIEQKCASIHQLVSKNASLENLTILEKMQVQLDNSKFSDFKL